MTGERPDVEAGYRWWHFWSWSKGFHAGWRAREDRGADAADFIQTAEILAEPYNEKLTTLAVALAEAEYRAEQWRRTLERENEADWEGRWQDAEGRVEQAEARIAAVLRLHQPQEVWLSPFSDERGLQCTMGCGNWPCPTAAALAPSERQNARRMSAVTRVLAGDLDWPASDLRRLAADLLAALSPTEHEGPS